MNVDQTPITPARKMTEQQIRPIQYKFELKVADNGTPYLEVAWDRTVDAVGFTMDSAEGFARQILKICQHVKSVKRRIGVEQKQEKRKKAARKRSRKQRKVNRR